MKKIKIKTSERGFQRAEFLDYYKTKCSIQKSSLADRQCIWFGTHEIKPLIMSSDAIRLGLRERTFDENDNGWVDFEIPKEVAISTRMHLDRKQVQKLLPILQHFVETGELS